MKELKFRNALIEAIFGACICTGFIIFLCVVILCVVFIGKEEHNMTVWFSGFAIALVIVWLLAGLAILLGKTVIVTSSEIKMCRGKKVKWILKKEEIEECIYNKMRWLILLDPISNINSAALQFKLQKNGKISSHCHCSLSKKQVNKIKANFDYPIREINTIREQ